MSVNPRIEVAQQLLFTANQVLHSYNKYLDALINANAPAEEIRAQQHVVSQQQQLVLEHFKTLEWLRTHHGAQPEDIAKDSCQEAE